MVLPTAPPKNSQSLAAQALKSSNVRKLSQDSHPARRHQGLVTPDAWKTVICSVESTVRYSKKLSLLGASWRGHDSDRPVTGTLPAVALTTAATPVTVRLSSPCARGCHAHPKDIAEISRSTSVIHSFKVAVDSACSA